MRQWCPFRKALLATTALVPLGLATAFANPQGGQVVGGNAQIQGQGTANVTVTQTTDRAIINWHTFDIGSGERVQFVQPGASSIALNRVTGGLGPSVIAGSLTANGRVFLVNPDGILFGAGAVVDTAGFLATTHDIKNDDFMAGRFDFSISGRADASIVNLGTITASNAGFAALVAPGVRNAGTISARLGTVALASGNAFSLDFYGDRLITLAVNDQIAAQVRDVATGERLDALVKNQGRLRANGGQVQLSAVTARAVVDSVINNTGVIEARTVGTRNGKIVLGVPTASTKVAGAPTQTVKLSGRLDVSGRRGGQSGGTVRVTGEAIEVTNATIDATGPAGGGNVLIGGDTGGGASHWAVGAIAKAALESEPVPTATTVSVDVWSRIDASAKFAGDGGKVIVWADGTTTYGGTILAKGGATAGDGGFVEVSGRMSLAYYGLVDTSATNGRYGTLLLDPYNLTISSDPSSGMSGFAAGAIDSVLNVGDLVAALTYNNVIVTTGLGGGQDGNILVTAAINWASASLLTLSAANDIDISAAVNSTSGGLTLQAGNNIAIADAIDLGNGGLTIHAGGAVAATAGIDVKSFTLQSGAWSQVGALPGFNVMNDFRIDGGSFLRAAGGLGTNISPYLIADVYGLQGIGSSSTLLTSAYALNTSINAASTAGWNGGEGFKPIGTMANPFNGVLDGDNFTISNLNITPTASTTTRVGMFGTIGGSGEVRDLNLNTPNVVANIPLSGTPTEAGVLAGHSSGLIQNVTVSGGTISSDSTRLHIGGLVGFQDASGEIVNSRSDLAVTATGNVGINALNCASTFSCNFVTAGGLVGYNQGLIKGTVAPDYIYGLGTYSTGAVTVGSLAVAGGLVGASDGVILQAGAWGNVTGGSGSLGVDGFDHVTLLGGFVGENRGHIQDSEAHGNVGSAGIYLLAGGFVGQNSGTIVTSVANGHVTTGAYGQAGGFAGLSLPWSMTCTGCNNGIGYNNEAEITESEAYGSVTVGHGSVAGGFAGSIGHSYENVSAGNVSGTNNSILGGFAGIVEIGALVSDSYSFSDVTATGANNWLGGFAGGNAGFITGSVADGTVAGGNSNVVGGFAGLNLGRISLSGTISGGSVTAGGDSLVGGLVGANFGQIDLTFADGDVTAGTGGIAGALVGANAAFGNIQPNLIPSSTFPTGTIYASSGSGLVNGSSTGPQVGANGITSMPAYPSIITNCDGDICSILKTASFTTPPNPALDELPFDVFATAIIVYLTGITDPVGQQEVLQALIEIASAPAGGATGPSGDPNQPGGSGPGGSQPGARGAVNPATGMPPQPLRPIAGPDGERFSSIPPIGETRFLNNEVVVQVPESVSPEQIAQIARQLGLSVITSQNLAALGRRAYRFNLPSGRNVRDMIRALEANSIVAVAQPNYRFRLGQAGLAPASAPSDTPELTQRGDPAQYMMGKLHLAEAHRLADGRNILVAVIDSEVDRDHSELRNSIAARFSTSDDADRPHSHGTAMAGAIASRDRLLGVAPSARILAIRAFSESNNTAESTTFSILKSIDHAVNQGAKVINMSFAGPPDPSLHRTLKAAAEKGVILIAAAGNAGPKSPPLFPAADPNVIAVTATDSSDRVFKMANRGPHIEVAAPGVDILAPAPEAGYQMSTGTSIATAHVSGVVALMLEKDPTLTPADVRQILQTTARDLGPKGKDPNFGWGLVDPHKALQAVMLRDAARRRQQTQ